MNLLSSALSAYIKQIQSNNFGSCIIKMPWTITEGFEEGQRAAKRGVSVARDAVKYPWNWNWNGYGNGNGIQNRSRNRSWGCDTCLSLPGDYATIFAKIFLHFSIFFYKFFFSLHQMLTKCRCRSRRWRRCLCTLFTFIGAQINKFNAPTGKKEIEKKRNDNICWFFSDTCGGLFWTPQDVNSHAPWSLNPRSGQD